VSGHQASPLNGSFVESPNMRIIALEEHFIMPSDPLPPGAHRGNDRQLRTGIDSGMELLDLGDRRIAAMDSAGIDVQVLSLNQPGCQALDAAAAVPKARDANDYLFQKIAAHPTRFAGLAALPTADPRAAAAELERAVTQLGFKGAMINGHTEGSFLDDPRYGDIFECAHTLGVPIYLHPRNPHPDVMKTYFKGYEELAFAAWGFALDTCSHFLRLVFAGVFDRYPKLTIILGHMGEGLPFWLHRADDHTQVAAKRRGLKKTLAEYLTENLMITCSGNFSVPAMVCSVEALGPDNIMFAVDWPYESNQAAVDFLSHLPLSNEVVTKIAHRNATRILGL
jgi:predicted TIM-barrel fold metal-dependent hydrolase